RPWTRPWRRSGPAPSTPVPTPTCVDALVLKCREGGRIANVSAVVATSVNADGYREILGLDVLTSEDGAGWTKFLRDLVARGLTGVRVATPAGRRPGHHGVLLAPGRALAADLVEQPKSAST